ncbi:MAG: GNAT family N-acetyltransferase [Lachnospirales bacterium]
MNTPLLKTERLILRKFTSKDLVSLYGIYSDTEVNKFLPWFPIKAIEEAQDFFTTHYKKKYEKPYGYNYAICLKQNNHPIGYINVSVNDSYDFGYGLCRNFWHKGIVTEASKAVIEQLKSDNIPYITATHDINNPRSGSVMKALGMKYCYTYEEQWQPKDFLVTFRMYQLDLNGTNKVYNKYWDNSNVHFIEKETTEK